MEEKIVIQIPIEEIVPNPYQPRRVFSEKSLEELKNSIASYGVLQPITVRKKNCREFMLQSVMKQVY